MKILITGNKGFVGTETAKLLETNGHQIIGFDILDGKDIRDKEQFEDIIFNQKPNRVLHLAAISRFADADRNPRLAFETNVLGTRNITEVCMKYHIPLVYASTGSAYMPIEKEPPTKEDLLIRGNSVYGCTKAMGEFYVNQHTPHIILRYAHLYGREKKLHGLVGGYISRIQRGLAPVLYGGNQSNDFCYIKDVAEANRLALITGWENWNEAYNIGTGEELTAERAGELIIKIMGWRGDIERKAKRTVDPGRFVYDVLKAEQRLGFKAKYSFEKGLQDMFTNL